jgi:transcriptional regulator with XRE-family HTH domain
MTILNQLSDRRILAELGQRLARQRLNRNMTQDLLAHEAGVSKRTIIRLEKGQSSQLTSLVRVLRALGLLANMDALAPSGPVSPVEALKVKAKQRRRASPAGSKPKTPPPKWTWGDDAPADRSEP